MEITKCITLHSAECLLLTGMLIGKRRLLIILIAWVLGLIYAITKLIDEGDILAVGLSIEPVTDFGELQRKC